MSGDAHAGLFGSLRHHIQITLLGALLVLAPLVLLVHTVLRVRVAVDKAVAPLWELLPGAQISVAGVSGIELATRCCGRRAGRWLGNRIRPRCPAGDDRQAVLRPA